MKRLIVFLVITAFFTGCVSNKKADDSHKPSPFPSASIPLMISSQEEAMQYLAGHFWDRYYDSVKVFSKDTAYIGGITKSDYTAAFTEYISILWQLPRELSYAAQKKAVEGASALESSDTSCRVYEYFTRFCEEALYGVNSDYRNEELYIPILENLCISPFVDSLLRIKYSKDLAECSLNRIGEKAADFSYTTAKGTDGHLYGVRSDYILLFFSNPGCHACLEIINSLKESMKVQYLIESGKMKVLNIYIDEDLAEWFKYMPVYPAEWINAYEPNLDIRTHNLYSVRAIPSLYFLDSEKRVVLKDVSPALMMNYLESL